MKYKILSNRGGVEYQGNNQDYAAEVCKLECLNIKTLMCFLVLLR